MATPFAILTALYTPDHAARNMAGAVVMMPIAVQDVSPGHARPLAQPVVQLLVLTADVVPLLVVLHVMLKVHLAAAVHPTDSAAPLQITASSPMVAKMDALMVQAHLQHCLLHHPLRLRLRHLKNQSSHLLHRHFQPPRQAVHL